MVQDNHRHCGVEKNRRLTDGPVGVQPLHYSFLLAGQISVCACVSTFLSVVTQQFDAEGLVPALGVMRR